MVTCARDARVGVRSRDARVSSVARRIEKKCPQRRDGWADADADGKADAHADADAGGREERSGALV